MENDPVQITSQLLETRMVARLLLGGSYPSLIADLGSSIRKVQAKKNCNAIEAALTIIRGISADAVISIYIMAAAAEVLAPGRDRIECEHGVILYGTRCLECDRNRQKTISSTSPVT